MTYFVFWGPARVPAAPRQACSHAHATTPVLCPACRRRPPLSPLPCSNLRTGYDLFYVLSPPQTCPAGPRARRCRRSCLHRRSPAPAALSRLAARSAQATCAAMATTRQPGRQDGRGGARAASGLQGLQTRAASVPVNGRRRTIWNAEAISKCAGSEAGLRSADSGGAAQRRQRRRSNMQEG